MPQPFSGPHRCMSVERTMAQRLVDLQLVRVDFVEVWRRGIAQMNGGPVGYFRSHPRYAVYHSVEIRGCSRERHVIMQCP
jgi:hypothetical protein